MTTFTSCAARRSEQPPRSQRLQRAGGADPGAPRVIAPAHGGRVSGRRADRVPETSDAGWFCTGISTFSATIAGNVAIAVIGGAESDVSGDPTPETSQTRRPGT